jgi:hypothetical protein
MLMANPNVSIAIDTGGRAAENNTYLGQEKIKEWNEEQEKEKEKLARRLVRQGIVSQEAMDQVYDSLTLVDLEEIRADHRRSVSKDTKGLGEMSYDAHKEGRQAQFDVLRGDFQLAKITKATSTLTTDLSPLGMVYGGIQLFEQYSAYKQSSQAEEKPPTSTPLQKLLPKTPYDVDPSEPFQSKEHARNANKLMSAINPHSPTQFEYAAAYSGQIKNPDDFRNLAPGAEYFKIAGDKIDRLSAKWGGKTRNATQKLALDATGNPHIAVTAGFGGALALDLVADPLLVAGGAGKVAQAGKAMIKGVSGAGAIARAAKGASGFSDAVAAAKNGSGLMDRGAQIAKPGIASRAAEAMGGKAGVTVEVEFKPGMDTRDFHKKVEALQDLANRGKLSVAERPIVRDKNLTDKHRQKLKDYARDMWSATDPQKAEAFKNMLKTKEVDHIQDLQVNGLDNAFNFGMLDATVNRSLGSQIMHQLKKVPEGTKIKEVIIKNVKDTNNP